MTQRIDASTRLIALLGDPVAHSGSPAIQNAAFAAADIPAVYLALRTAPGTVESIMRLLIHAGGAGNVTIPHKAEAAVALDRPSSAVLRTGACNTFWKEDGGALCGDNTDVAGFVAAVRELLPGGIDGPVLVLGAGGAARAVIAGLIDVGVRRIVIANRSVERARALASAFRKEAADIVVPSRTPDTSWGLVVNATSQGMSESDPMPIEPSIRAAAVLDLVYRRGGTRWVREMERSGVSAADGSAMLIAQAAAAFERWWGVPAPLHAMRRAFEEWTSSDRIARR